MYTFSKESFSFFPENENPEKVIYISGNGNSNNLLILPETEFSEL